MLVALEALVGARGSGGTVGASGSGGVWGPIAESFPTWIFWICHVAVFYSPRRRISFPPKFHLIPPKFHFVST